MDEMRSIIDMTVPTKLNIFVNKIRFVNTTAGAPHDEVPGCFIKKLVIWL